MAASALKIGWADANCQSEPKYGVNCPPYNNASR